jgi:ethanolamine ammonia-lyase small subunit
MTDPTPVEPSHTPSLIDAIRARTPARVFVDRSGPAYRTDTQLALRADHAAARDAVWAEVDLHRDLGSDFVHRYALFDVSTRAASKEEFLLHPDLGRQLDDSARELLRQRCPTGSDLQVFIGDGLSAAAVAAQVPALLPLLLDRAQTFGWTVGQPFLVHHCRVGVFNDVGELLAPVVAVLLIGERPGLATAESLSAYMAYRPRPGDTDARRNLISNIHHRGVGIDEAARRILALAQRMRDAGASGVRVKEELPAPGVERLAGGQA